LIRLQVSPFVSSDVDGNIYFQETPLPKAGRLYPKALIERDWNTDVRIDVIEPGVLTWDANQTFVLNWLICSLLERDHPNLSLDFGRSSSTGLKRPQVEPWAKLGVESTH
jgi:hypothetical protein